MDDLISRKGLMEKVRCKNNTDCKHCDFYTDGDTWCDGCVYGTTIMQTPAVDAVEVVRCKDCKHWHEDDDIGYCDNPDGLDNYARPDDFCSYGERKADGA